MITPNLHLKLPNWLIELTKTEPLNYPNIEDRMMLVIRLAQLNIQYQTGGPFGAAVFNMNTYELISVGVNLVVPSSCSIAHAEMLAISTAQQRLKQFDLGAEGLSDVELVTSSEPCAMCFGALHWSGIHHLVCGSRDEDVRNIGFDEGPKHPQWIQELEKRNIKVTRDVCREEAIKVLQSYAHEGEIYNGRQGLS
ncbi:MAG: nucleoside deaminase [Mariprofundaceae bacterium]